MLPDKPLQIEGELSVVRSHRMFKCVQFAAQRRVTGHGPVIEERGLQVKRQPVDPRRAAPKMGDENERGEDTTPGMG